jgi:hypothetical protein
MDRSQPQTASFELVKAHLLLAREKLVLQKTRLEIELQQIGQGIQSIDTTIDMVCAANTFSVDPSMLPSDGAEPAVDDSLALTEETSSPGASPITAKQQTTKDLPASALKTQRAKTKTASSKSSKSASSRPKASTTGKGGAASSTKSRKTTPTTKKKTSNTRSQPAKSSKGKSAAGRKTEWKTYLLKKYQDQPLTEVVLTIFQESPDAVLASSDLISRIFVPEIPKDVRATARDRLLNILSLRVGDHQLERVGSGKYKLAGSPT